MYTRSLSHHQRLFLTKPPLWPTFRPTFQLYRKRLKLSSCEINEVEATIRKVEKAVQDANDLLKGDRSWDTMGFKWVKSLIDGFEELKKVLRKEVEELREEYREDIGALKVALAGIKTNVQEIKTGHSRDGSEDG